MVTTSTFDSMDIVAARLPRATQQARPLRLMERFRMAVRARRYSRRTERSYARCIKRFIHFHALRHPEQTGAPEIDAFLTHLAVEMKVSASTHNQALAAPLFLYRHVL